MIRSLFPLVFPCFLTISLLAAEPPAWPQANGPTGNFTPRPTDVKLIDDCAQAKQVWLSETSDLGYAKGSASGYVQNLARWPGHPGSSSGPILAEGKLFVTTFRPAGEARATEQPQLKSLADSKKPFTPEENARLHDNLRIEADDLLVAIDAATGKTAWTAVEAGRGLNRYMGKRQGFCISPAYHDGRVFSLGTTGLLYAYDAADGKKLWETHIDKAHAFALARKEDATAKKMLPGGLGWDVSLVVADGVLVVPLFDGNDLSLRGVHVASGETLWEAAKVCSRHATPGVWTHGDRQYLVAATVAGELRAIDPRDGRVLWKVDGLGENHFSLAPLGDLVLVNGGSNKLRKDDSDAKYGLLAAYRLSPKKATLVWKHEEKPELYFSTWMDSCARRFLAVADGRVYFRAHGVRGENGENNEYLHQLDAATGRVLASNKVSSPALQYYPVGDRLLTIRDASHSETDLAFFQVQGDKLVQLAEFWHPPHMGTTAYEVYMENPYEAGRFYMRTKDGRIACYDLRKE